MDGDGWTVADGDCDDLDPFRNPSVPEDGGTGTGESNGVDDDCDGVVDEGTDGYDDDLDGYTEDDGDCDDFNPSVHPGMVEDPTNGIDDDCDGATDGLAYCDCPTTSDLAVALDLCEGVFGNTVTGPAYQVIDSFGPYVPQGGCSMIALSSGVIGSVVEPGTDHGAFGPTDDTTTLTLTLVVPMWSSSFSFSFNFMSAEYPEWVGSEYNDFFYANLTSGAFNGNVSFDSSGVPIQINNAFFSVTDSASLAGTHFDGGVGGGTGWLETTSPVVAGEIITLEFTIGDISDGNWDSTVLIDNFRWGVDNITTPDTQQ